MYNILTLNKISKFGLEKFDTSKYAYGDSFDAPDAIMVRSAAMHDMELAANTVAIARAGAGVNNIPVEACAEKGVVVFNTPGANANAVKELVLCGLLISSRRVIDAIDWCKTLKGEGAAVGKLVEKGKSDFVGPEIEGKILGVIGLGAIGNLVANAAVAIGMEVIGYDPFLSVNGAICLSPAVKVTSDIKEVIASSDYITLHVPFNDATKGLINTDSLANAKDGVRILNFARGELVNSADIIAALESGKVSFYVTDFPNDEIIGVKGVIAIPHLGASTPESEDNCAKMAAAELIDYLEKGIIRNSVNYPDVMLPNTFETRVCVLHKDAPGVQAAVTAAVGSAESIVSGTKKGYGYTVADIKGDIDSEKLKAIDGVVRVRVIK
jgi:D-3-phosphoglycerate dehydrogenase